MLRVNASDGTTQNKKEVQRIRLVIPCQKHCGCDGPGKNAAERSYPMPKVRGGD